MAGIPGLIADQDFTPISTPSEAQKLENITKYTDKTLMEMANNPQDPKSQVYALSVLMERQKYSKGDGQAPQTTVKDDVASEAQEGVQEGVQEALPTQYARAGGVMNLGSNVGNYAGGGIVAFNPGGAVYDPEARPYTDRFKDIPLYPTEEELSRMPKDIADKIRAEKSLKERIDKAAERKDLEDINIPSFFKEAKAAQDKRIEEKIAEQEKEAKQKAEEEGKVLPTSEKTEVKSENKLFEAANLEDAPYKPSTDNIEVQRNPYDPYPEEIKDVFGMPANITPEEYKAEQDVVKEQFGLNKDFYTEEQKRIDKLEEAAKANTTFDRNLRLAQMGARMASSKSPFFAQAVGEAGTATISDLMQDRKADQARQDLLRKERTALNLRSRAEDQNDVKGYNEKTKEIRGIQKDLLKDFFDRKLKNATLDANLSKEERMLRTEAIKAAQADMKARYGEDALITRFRTNQADYDAELNDFIRKNYAILTGGGKIDGISSPRTRGGIGKKTASSSANSLADEIGL
jgi:hypothetical protein